MSAWRMTKPCADCPFSDSERGQAMAASLRPGRLASIKADLRQGRTFSCHKTVVHDDDGEHVLTPRERLCAGAIAYREAHGCVSNTQRVMERLDALSAGRRQLTGGQ